MASSLYYFISWRYILTFESGNQTHYIDLIIREFIDSSPEVLITILTLIGGWSIGTRLTTRWNLWQKKKEADIAAVDAFHILYGEFFAIWKMWNYLKIDKENGVTRWSIFERSCLAEAKMEALFVRIATERELGSSEIETLGKFRQAFQQLREAIRANKELPWDSSSNSEYIAFKQLASKFAHIILTHDVPPSVSTRRSVAQLLEITDNRWEDQWVDRDNSV